MNDLPTAQKDGSSGGAHRREDDIPIPPSPDRVGRHARIEPLAHPHKPLRIEREESHDMPLTVTERRSKTVQFPTRPGERT